MACSSTAGRRHDAHNLLRHLAKLMPLRFASHNSPDRRFQ